MTSQGTTLIQELEHEIECLVRADNWSEVMGLSSGDVPVRIERLRARAARARETEATSYLSSGLDTYRALTGPLPGPSGGAGDGKQKETKP